MSLPLIIQGGMGIGVSGWQLAKAVSATGQLGVVSGTALDSVLVRRLQLGDPGGDVRRALDAYPDSDAVDRILDRYYVEGGKPTDERFVQISMKRDNPSRNMADLLIVANFAEVYLAKEGHLGQIGINYLEKVQSPTLPSLYGAMLAGIDYVFMGAGIPKTIPGVLERMAVGEPVELKLDVKGAKKDDRFVSSFDPGSEPTSSSLPLARPRFVPIVSSHTLAVMLATKVEGSVDGFVVEGHTAGGHNAPPRGKRQLSETGEPIYGKRDQPDLSIIRDLGLPFWLAGGYATAERLDEALALGAAGIQVGTPFAYCEESGLDPEVRRQVVAASRDGKISVRTDAEASPSGFPFKVVELEGTLAEAEVYDERVRPPCQLGYLRTAYRTDDGRLVWRCPAEPVDTYLAHGGAVEETEGRMCLCNALLANISLPQVQSNGEPEPMLITSGNDIDIARFLPADAETYTAADVIQALLAGRALPEPTAVGT
jgi:nitronate monooxygenase